MLLSHTTKVPPACSRRTTEGTVAAAHDVSVQAGLAMLAQGGNAVDAAVAAALVAGVIEPTETTLAGCGFMLIGDATSVHSVEFGPRAPLAARETMFKVLEDAAASNILGLAPVEGNANVDGPRASGVPRTITGLLEAQARFGKLDRRTVMEPAIRAAADGFEVDSWFLVNTLSDLTRLAADPGAAAVFLEDGLPVGRLRQGYYGHSVDFADKVRQPTLARTLDQLADQGPTSVTSGEIGRSLLATFEEYGLLLTAADLANAGPDIRPPLTRAYRGVDVHVPNAPGGGMTELEILGIWEWIYPDGAPIADSPERIRNLALAIKHAFADRYHWLGDPDHVPVPVDELLSASYSRRLARQCLSEPIPESFGDGSAPWGFFAEYALHNPYADPSQAPVWTPGTATEPTTGTTHVTAADADGMFVTITHTAANHYGSGIVCPRTGFLLDSQMAWFNALPGAANSIRPGARPLANMGPVLLTDARGAFAAIGASGGRRIVSAVAQIVINLVDRAMSPLEALQAPRIDGSGPNTVLPQELAHLTPALEGLAPMVIPPTSSYYALDFARANLVGAVEGGLESAVDAQCYSY